MTVIGVDGKFLLQMGESQEWGGGVGFIMGGWEVFEVLLHSWQRGAKSPVFYEDPLYCLPSLFQILANLPHFPVTSNPHPHSFCCPVSLAEWVIT